MVMNKIIRHFRDSFQSERFMEKARSFSCVRSVNKYTKSGHYAVMVVPKETFPPDVYEALLEGRRNYALESEKDKRQ